jgi:hypothetical protein
VDPPGRVADGRDIGTQGAPRSALSSIIQLINVIIRLFELMQIRAWVPGRRVSCAGMVGTVFRFARMFWPRPPGVTGRA